MIKDKKNGEHIGKNMGHRHAEDTAEKRGKALYFVHRGI